MGLADLELIEDLDDVSGLVRNLGWLGWLSPVTAPIVPNDLVIARFGQLLG